MSWGPCQRLVSGLGCNVSRVSRLMGEIQMSDSRDRVAALVVAHEWHSDGTGEGQCECDARWFKTKELWTLHLADVVITELGQHPTAICGGCGSAAELYYCAMCGTEDA